MNAAQIGPPGTGKTKSLLTILPFVKRQKKPFVVIDIDGKFLDDPKAKQAVDDGYFIYMDPGLRLSQGKFSDRIKKIESVPVSSPAGWMKMGDIIDDLDQNATQFCGASMDTLTFLEDHIKAFISFTNKRAKFEYSDWTALQLSYKELFHCFYSLNMPLKIINMHSQLDKDELTGRVEIYPKITGGFRDVAGSFPTEYFFNTTQPNPDKTKPPLYVWQVTPDSRFVARSNIFEGKIFVPQDWEPICRTLG